MGCFSLNRHLNTLKQFFLRDRGREREKKRNVAAVVEVGFNKQHSGQNTVFFPSLFFLNRGEVSQAQKLKPLPLPPTTTTLTPSPKNNINNFLLRT